MARKKFVILTPDLAGVVKNGGVGTAKASLALLLAAAGHEVTVVFVSRFQPEDFEFHLWQDHYRERGVKLISLPEPAIALEGNDGPKLSYASYLFLKEHDFDVAIFPDMRGYGYYSCMAKRQGIAFQGKHIAVVLNGPDYWHKMGNGGLCSTLPEIQFFHFERLSLELADSVISPSQYAIDWARENGWKLPRDTRVIQYPNPDWTGASELPRGKIDEIVFFGRLETRKGFEIFCDALERLSPKLLEGRTVTFLGGPGLIGSRPAEESIDARKQRWKFRWKVVSDRDRSGAIDYLKARSCLAVLPSRSETLGYTAIECLTFGIPFILSDIPAFRELISDSAKRSVFFSNSAGPLAERIRKVLRHGPAAASFKVSPTETNTAWLNWADQVKAPVLGPLPARRPRVSVCLAHRDRPELLKQALESIEAQTYGGKVEVIVADDASEKKDTHRKLRELERRYAARGWKILRGAERKGPGTCRNLAASKAKGEYLLFMDDDNLAKPEEIETFVTAALRRNADILTCPFDRFFESESASQGGPTPESRWLPMGNDIATGFFLNTFGDTNSLIRTKTFRELGGFKDFGHPGAEDWALFYRAVMQGYTLEVVPEALVLYRMHGSNWLKHTDPFENIRMRLDAFASGFKAPEAFAFASIVMANYFRNEWQMNAYLGYPFTSLLNPARTDRFGVGLAPDRIPDARKSLPWKGRHLPLAARPDWIYPQIFRLRDQVKVVLIVPKSAAIAPEEFVVLLRGKPVAHSVESEAISLENTKVVIRVRNESLAGASFEKDVEIYCTFLGKFAAPVYSLGWIVAQLERGRPPEASDSREPVFEAEGRLRVLRRDGKAASWSIPQDALQAGYEGYIENLRLDSSRLSLAGWAANPKNGKPASSVIVLEKGRKIREIPIDQVRPDLARGFRKSSLYVAGFNETLSLPPGSMREDFLVVALWDDGSAAFLKPYNLSAASEKLLLRPADSSPSETAGYS
ncbi:MAG TPA: glycosyltransferase [Bdellovibrionota bacterium]|nr:glycosyltransferase [Bdellovibrionota bacterium]